MSTRPLLLAALASAVLLGGCGGTKNTGLESVHQPVVARTDFVFDAVTAPGGLAAGEVSRLTGWMDALHLGYGDTIAIDDPYRANRAARADVAAVTARYGLLVSDAVPVTGAEVAPGTIRVVVSRSRATVPGCPDYSRVGQPDFNSNTSSNQGCSTNSNLAAMVANPLDLVRGSPGTGEYDAQSGTRAINEFRKATPTGAGGTVDKSESAGGGK